MRVNIQCERKQVEYLDRRLQQISSIMTTQGWKKNRITRYWNENVAAVLLKTDDDFCKKR